MAIRSFLELGYSNTETFTPITTEEIDVSRKCEHGMMSWECIDCTDRDKLIKLKSEAKLFIDANVWDGEDRSGATNDRACFNPDSLQELIDELTEHMFNH